jgi:hypothetical protein
VGHVDLGRPAPAQVRAGPALGAGARPNPVPTVATGTPRARSLLPPTPRLQDRPGSYPDVHGRPPCLVTALPCPPASTLVRWRLWPWLYGWLYEVSPGKHPGRRDPQILSLIWICDARPRGHPPVHVVNRSPPRAARQSSADVYRLACQLAASVAVRPKPDAATLRLRGDAAGGLRGSGPRL